MGCWEVMRIIHVLGYFVGQEIYLLSLVGVIDSGIFPLLFLFLL